MGKRKKWKKSFLTKQEKRNLHTRYICGISLCIALLCVILSAYNHQAFVAQFDFASIIVSIVLSVTAIWLSISGERKTTEIKDKIVESAGQLSETTKKIKTLNGQYKETMGSQLKELENVQKRLSDLFASVSDMQKQVAATHEELAAMNSTTIVSGTQSFSPEQLEMFFDNIYIWNCGTGHNAHMEWVFCEMARLIMDYRQKQSPYTYLQIVTQLGNSGVYIPQWNNAILVSWGSLNTLTAIGVFDNPGVTGKIKEKIAKPLANNPFSTQ